MFVILVKLSNPLYPGYLRSHIVTTGTLVTECGEDVPANANVEASSRRDVSCDACYGIHAGLRSR